MAIEPGSPSQRSSKRLRRSSPQLENEIPHIAHDMLKPAVNELESENSNFADRVQEWRESLCPLQEDAIEQGKEDAKLETGVNGFVRLQDVDESLTTVLAGIASKRPTEALTDFRELLRGVNGGKVLQQYVLLSPKCTEIMSAWSLGHGAESAVPLLLLVYELLQHPMGKGGSQDSIDSSQDGSANRQKVLLVVRVRLDKLARSIISTKLKDIYAHLMSNERSRQNASLHLMACIVRRGSMLASEVAATFDFTLSALPRLSKASKSTVLKGGEKKTQNILKTLKLPTRFAFIEFALSFLEVCHAALLRWVLQIRPLYVGILHKLSSDDEMTIVTVLRVVLNKVLDAAAMVPPGLQSAIFGDVALEQLAIISSNLIQGQAALIAHDILLLLCTDPSHGICPEASSFSWGATSGKTGTSGGGQGRLARLMLKLRATENPNHRKLLLSIAAGRPVLVAAYFESYPYSLEPRASTAWSENMP